MSFRWRWPLVLGAGVCIAAPGIAASLARHLSQPEAQYKWEKGTETQVGFVTVTDLKMRSQVWRGIPWDHTVRVFRPATVKYPKTALLFIKIGRASCRDRGRAA